jgi:nucleotide-binding universal stress UspA family protein
MFKNVMVGADDSATALRAVVAAVEVARMAGATLHYPLAFGDLDNVYEGYPDEAANVLPYRLGAAATRAKVEAQFHAITGDPVEAIVGIADQVGADLIVVGNKGMRGARRVLGSIPNSIAHTRNAQSSLSIRQA